MVGLLDIAEARPETVSIRGQDVEIYGLSALMIANIVRSHEELADILDGIAAFSPKIIVDAGPEVVAEIIAAGCGKPGDVRYVEKAATLSAGEQYDVIAKILEVTFGANLGPFVEKLKALSVSTAGAPSVATAPSAGEASSTTSRPRSRASLRSDTRPEMFGATHPGNSKVSPS